MEKQISGQVTLVTGGDTGSHELDGSWRVVLHTSSFVLSKVLFKYSFSLHCMTFTKILKIVALSMTVTEMIQTNMDNHFYKAYCCTSSVLILVIINYPQEWLLTVSCTPCPIYRKFSLVNLTGNVINRKDFMIRTAPLRLCILSFGRKTVRTRIS